MNIDNMKKLQACMENVSARDFNMRAFFRVANPCAGSDDDLGLGCGAPSCIAGWALHSMPRENLEAQVKAKTKEHRKTDFYGFMAQPIAREWLGLSVDEANTLFITGWRALGPLDDLNPTCALSSMIREITPTNAVKALGVCIREKRVPVNLWTMREVVAPTGVCIYGQEYMARLTS